LADYLYNVLALSIPYSHDLSARINDAQFKSKVGMGITTKLNLIRKLGDHAVHDQKPIPPRTALDALRELHHVMLWAAFRYSSNPQAVPLKSTFDAAPAAKAAPLTREEVGNLAARFKAQDEAHAKTLAERDELVAVKDTEIAALRSAIEKAQAANQKVDDQYYSEAETRDLFIDIMLGEAGWPLNDERYREFEVTGMPTNGGVGYVTTCYGEPTDCLWRSSKRSGPRKVRSSGSSRPSYTDWPPARHLLKTICIFYSNGFEHWIWDDASGYAQRQVQGFYTAAELELTVLRRQTRLPLSDAAIDSVIVERHYQIRAIRAIDDAFSAKQREALLVMATGAGKTRTVIALAREPPSEPAGVKFRYPVDE
jgi:type I restriction enzyme R subunit